MVDREVYLGLGGNIGNTSKIFREAVEQIANIPYVQKVILSPLYRTKPISKIPQNCFINAVCRLHTSLEARELLYSLQNIEKNLGKVAKPKDAPRMIDIDILFFGSLFYQEPDLEIPHPRWKDRLFVLKPLSDLVSFITVPTADEEMTVSLSDLLKNFINFHQEYATLYNEKGECDETGTG